MVKFNSAYYADEVRVHVSPNKTFHQVFLAILQWFYPYVHPSFIMIISATSGTGIVCMTIKDDGQKLQCWPFSPLVPQKQKPQQINVIKDWEQKLG